jgi:hypothetical protein
VDLLLPLCWKLWTASRVSMRGGGVSLFIFEVVEGES